MQSPNEQPERLIRPTPAPTSSGGGLQMSGGIRQIIIMAIIAIIVSFGLAVAWILPQTESAANFKANIGPMVTDITTLKNTQKGDEGTIATLSSQITTVSKQIQDIQSSMSSISAAAARVTAIQQSLDALTAKVNALPTSQPDLNPIRTQLTTLQTAFDAVKADVAVLKTGPSVPVSSPPTITGFSPTSGTSGTQVIITGTNFNAASTVTFGGVAAQSFTVNSGTQITAIVNGGATGAVSVATPAGSVSNGTFTYTGTTTAGTVTVSGIGDLFGQPYVVFSNISANTSTSRQFVFTVNNGAGKTITGVQFLIALQALTVDYQPTDLPAGATIKITSASMIGTLWQQQPVGGGVFAFTNQVLTGVLSGLGTISQNVGTQQYSISVTVTTKDAPIDSVYLYPTVKVLAYN